MDNDTIFALSTPFMKSAIAIVRVSGANSLDSLKNITGLTNPIPNKTNLVNIMEFGGSEILDRAIIIYFKGGNSYSGEDLVEYHIHGSLYVIKSLLNILAKQNNHRLAEAGEFTRRALYNNKLDIYQAEGIIDLINSETYIQKKQSMNKIDGSLNSFFKKWHDVLFNNLSLVEAKIDFDEEDISDDLIIEVKKDINNLVLEISSELNKTKFLKPIRDGFNLVIIGSVNVGKSSLINYLTKRDIAMVSNFAGTTRDVIESYVDIDGYPVVISDTAGIREADNEIEKEGIKRGIEKSNLADIRLCLLSADNISDSYKEIVDYIDDNSIVVVNKVDIEHDRDSIFKVLGDIKPILISVKEEIGLDILLMEIKNKLSNLYKLDDNIFIQERSVGTVKSILKELNLFLNNIDIDITVASYHLRESINYLSSIYGKVNVEDILDNIFSNFCIGK